MSAQKDGYLSLKIAIKRGAKTFMGSLPSLTTSNTAAI
jgi:hypothetical protein